MSFRSRHCNGTGQVRLGHLCSKLECLELTASDPTSCWWTARKAQVTAETRGLWPPCESLSSWLQPGPGPSFRYLGSEWTGGRHLSSSFPLPSSLSFFFFLPPSRSAFQINKSKWISQSQLLSSKVCDGLCFPAASMLPCSYCILDIIYAMLLREPECSCVFSWECWLLVLQLVHLLAGRNNPFKVHLPFSCRVVRECSVFQDTAVPHFGSGLLLFSPLARTPGSPCGHQTSLFISGYPGPFMSGSRLLLPAQVYFYCIWFL